MNTRRYKVKIYHSFKSKSWTYIYVKTYGCPRSLFYNLLGSAFGKAGSVSAELAGYDPIVGNKIGRGVFMISSIAFGSIGSIKILNIKSLSAVRFGVGGQPGGLEVGRIAMGYASGRAKDGMTIINISNNPGHIFLDSLLIVVN